MTSSPSAPAAVRAPMPWSSYVTSAAQAVAGLDGFACRWPLGAPADDDFAFCGGRRLGRGSYCAVHQAGGRARRGRRATGGGGVVRPLWVERRRRGAFGLDERRRPDPARVESELRSYLAAKLPEVWPLPGHDEEPGHTLTLLLPRGHVAILRLEPKPERPGADTAALVARCRAMRIPCAVVSSLDEGRAALRRFGVEPRPAVPAPDLAAVFGRR